MKRLNELIKEACEDSGHKAYPSALCKELVLKTIDACMEYGNIRELEIYRSQIELEKI